MKTSLNKKPSDILVVEDDEDLREELISLLSTMDVQGKGVGTISQAKREMKRKMYNVILLDLYLPDGHGMELLKELQKAASDTKVIVITGSTYQKDNISSVREGAFAYIRKPLDIDELRRSIRWALDVQRLSQA